MVPWFNFLLGSIPFIEFFGDPGRVYPKKLAVNNRENTYDRTEDSGLRTED